MTDLRNWERQQPHRAMCPEPGPSDRFLVILVNGKRVGIQPIEQFERLRMTCVSLAFQHKCQIKVLPVTGAELLALCGIEPAHPKPLADLDPAFREQAIKNCMDALRECQNPDIRAEALDLLRLLGGVQ